MKINFKAIAIGAGAVSATSILTNVIFIKDLRDYKYLYKILSKQIQDGIDIEVPPEIIQSAIEKKASSVVNDAIDDVSDRVLASYKIKIDTEAREIVAKEFRSVRDDVKKTLKDKIGKLDLKEIKEDILEECKEAAKDRFKDDLDVILKDYKKQIESISDIYKSIASSIKEKNYEV